VTGADRTDRPLRQLGVWLVGGLFLLWSAGFILRSSVRLGDGSRTFCLFDDAMISMRYAESLVEGRGLVWNTGERVEGYSNPLMVGVMALFLAALPKPQAVLAIQLLGVALVLATGLTTVRLYDRVAGPAGRAPPWLILAAALSVYTLSYWAILGMETGLVAALTIVGALTAIGSAQPVAPASRRHPGQALRLGWITALLYLCRPDALLIGATLALPLCWAGRRPSWGAAFRWALPTVAVIALHTAFRLAYYGEWLPNTATLKLAGIPLRHRLHDGATFVGPFLEGLTPLLALAVYSIAHTPTWRKGLLVAPMAVLVAYQVFVGGEPWAYWRIMSPAMPLLLVVALDGAMLLASRALPSPTPGRTTLLAGAALVLALAIHNKPLLREALLLERFREAVLNTDRVRAGYALREVTGPNATVAVVGAGAIPFYAERRGVDMLGKCDPEVARMRPDLTGSVSWYGMITMPGHNKYDLRRSIIEARPTYVETPRWGADDLSKWVEERYAQVVYKGVPLWLLRGSSDVLWDRLPRAEQPPAPEGEKGPSAQVAEADLDGDGRFERVVLDPDRPRTLTVSQSGVVVASDVPARWKPWKLALADVDGDGRIEIAVGVYKPTRHIPRPHNCLFVYSFADRNIVPHWLGSSLSRPFTDFLFAPPSTSRGPWPLYAIEAAPGGRSALAEYRWNGFGFTLDRRRGSWRSARLVKASEREVELEADGRRIAFARGAR